MPESGVVRAAIVQAKWTGDTASMIEVHENYAREAAAAGREDHGLPGGLQRAVLLPGAGGRALPLGRAGARRPDGDRGCSRWPGRRAWCSCVPVFEIESAGNYYNTAAVIDADGTVLGKYRKHHIPQVKGFWEKYYFRPGNLGWPVFDTAVGTVGRLHLLRPALPRGLAGAGPGRRADRVQPVGDQPRACRRTCGSSSSRPRPWPTSTSSRRSTGSASRSTATTTSTAPATSSTRAASSSARSPRRTTRSWSSATWT